MAVTVDEALVTRLAGLANLELSAGETSALTRDLARILAYVEILESADVSDVEPLAAMSRDRDRRRPDEPVPSLPRDVSLSQAPRSSDGGFEVPAFVDEG